MLQVARKHGVGSSQYLRELLCLLLIRDHCFYLFPDLRAADNIKLQSSSFEASTEAIYSRAPEDTVIKIKTVCHRTGGVGSCIWELGSFPVSFMAMCQAGRLCVKENECFLEAVQSQLFVQPVIAC